MSFIQWFRLICLVLLITSPSISFSENDAESGNFHRFWPDNLFAVDFVNDQVGFIAGYSGTVLRTKDAGQNWDALYIGRNELIRRLSFVDEQTGWAVGHRGSIFHTADGGQTWQVQKELPGIYLRDIDFVDQKTGWVVGHNMNIWHTRDGGETWQEQKLLGFQGRDVPRLHGIYAKDTKTAILVGEFGVVGHTENGGDTWLVTPIKSNITWLAIDGSGESVYAAGLDGNIVRLEIATEEQRAETAERLAKKAARKEKKARAKAKRLKKEYVPPKVEELPYPAIDYHAETIDSKTSEHFLDIAVAANGDAIAVGRSTVLKVSGSSIAELKTSPDFPLPYVWFGGVDITPNGTLWAPGIRGMVISGNVNDMSFGSALSLAASTNVTLVSNRWGDKK